MNAPTNFANGTTMSAREFNQHNSKAKKAAEQGPVFITDRGRPAYVLLTNADYRRLVDGPKSLYDSLVPDDDIDIDFDAYLPKREIEPMRPAFDDEQE